LVIVEKLDTLLEGRLVAPAVIVIACLAAFCTSPLNGFVADDHAIISQNPLVIDPGRMFEALTTPYLDVMYRPLTILSFSVQWFAFGDAPWVFHLFNVLLHAVVSVLVWRLVHSLTRVRPTAALAAGILFAVHTIHTDAVSAVVGRSEVLAGAFAIGSFLAWRRWATAGPNSRVAVAGILFLLGLLSKESAAPLLVFTMLWTIVTYFRGDAAAPDVARRGGLSLAAAWATAYLVPLVAYLMVRYAVLGGSLVVEKNEYFGMVGAWQTLLTMLGVGARYAWLMLFPSPLAPDYSWESIQLAESVLDPWTLAGLVLVPATLVTTAILVTRRRTAPRSAGMCLVWFIVFMAPASNIIPLMIPMAERITYLATAGLFAAAAPLCHLAFKRAAIPVIVVVGVYLALLTGMTVDRNRVWQDDLTLWSDTVATHPRSAVSLANLAGALIGSGKTNAGVAALQRALEVGPWKWGFREVLANVLDESGRHRDEARLLLDGLKWSGRSTPDADRICDAVLKVAPDMGRKVCLDRVRQGHRAWKDWP